jgi:hypothetical protein
MSYFDWDLINDQELIANLLKLAQQVNPNPPDPNVLATAKTLAMELKKQLAGPQEVVQELDPRTPVDSFADKTFDASNPLAHSGPKYPLTMGNLSSKASLTDWLSEPMAQIASAGALLPFDGAPGVSGNHCTVVQVLYHRALHNQELSRSDHATKIAEYYVRQIQAIGQQFVGPDGKACSIVMAGQTAPAPHTNVSKTELIHDIADILPFNSSEININDIKRFTDQYAQLASNDTNVINLAQSVNNSIEQVKTSMNPYSPVIPLSNLDTSQFKMMSSNPRGPIMLARYLYELIDSAGKLYSLFVGQTKKTINDTLAYGGPDVAEAIQQQLASSGPFISNRNRLNEFIQQLQRESIAGMRH